MYCVLLILIGSVQEHQQKRYSLSFQQCRFLTQDTLW